MQTVELTAYDQVLYPNFTYPQTHPDRLATIAKLLGMQPAPIRSCRVLELGCGNGGNLLPMAFNLPSSQFVGIDLASALIAHGTTQIAKLGLTNIQLLCGDLARAGSELGEFDYIICHGIYSWVPAVVRENILALCRLCLAPQGVAYISYNTYPGFYLRAITRDIMRFHTLGQTNAAAQVFHSRGLVKWLAEAQPCANAYGVLLSEINQRFAVKTNGAVFHDDLADINVSFYFHEFASEAARHGLQYLAEAEFSDTQDYEFSGEVREQLMQLGADSLLTREQYLDYLKGRAFRQTLLCHHQMELIPSLCVDSIKQFYFRSNAKPTVYSNDIYFTDINSDVTMEFRGAKGGVISTDIPLAKAALTHLREVYPHSFSFADLLHHARLITAQRVTSYSAVHEANILAEALLTTYRMGLIDCGTEPDLFQVDPGEFPQASALARLQAREGNIITSLYHTNINLEDDLSRQLLVLLDGTRNKDDLIAIFKTLIASCLTAAAAEQDQLIDEEQFVASLPEKIKTQLATFGSLGLLMA